MPIVPLVIHGLLDDRGAEVSEVYSVASFPFDLPAGQPQLLQRTAADSP